MIRKSLYTLILGAVLAIFASPVDVSAQAMESVEPFKVGTFAINDVPTVGLVMRDDQLIVELAAEEGDGEGSEEGRRQGGGDEGGGAHGAVPRRSSAACRATRTVGSV